MFAFQKSSFARFAARLSAFKSAQNSGDQTSGRKVGDRARGAIQIDGFVGAFGGLVTGMEERFVPLGEDLAKVVRHLQSLTQAAGEGFNSIREDLTNGTLGELDVRAVRALNTLQQQLGGVTERMQPLQDMADDLRTLRSLGTEVKRIGAFLQACGSSFAVESARREESRAAFASFVEELRALANQIGGLAERMNQDSQATLTQLTDAGHRIRTDVRELERLASAMGSAFSTASGEIQGLLADMRNVLDRVERHRASISEKTGGVIFYLQFGDIVRQKCEHVLAAAREAQSAAKTPSRETLAIIIHTAASQLEVIRGEVGETRGRLGESYAALQSELTQLADCGRALSDAGKMGSSDAWSRLKTRLQDLDGIQAQEATLNADALRTAGEVGESAAALHASLGSVREMSCHLHLLALNAIIQTAHLGIHGRTLEELAQHVDGLHRTCEQLVPQVLAILDGIAQRVQLFSVQESEHAGLDLGGVQELETAQHRCRSVMAEVLALASQGEELLQQAVQRLATLDALSAEIETHRGELLRMAEQLPALAEASAAASDFDARMLERYTMQSERDAHLRSRGLAPSAKPELEVELFGDDAAEFGVPEFAAAAASPASGADDDNIELF